MKNLLTPFFALLVSISSAQEFNSQKLDSLLNYIEVEQMGMGSLAIAKNGITVYEKAFGNASIKDKIPATTATKYRIGSITKTFTSSLIMQLIEKEQLTLDTKLAEFFPEVINADSISVEQLLRHQSGIYNFTSDPEYKKYMEHPMSKEELLQTIVDLGSVFKPGSKTAYSNSNYVLLAFVTEQLTNTSYEKLIQERICEPCNLKDTYYGGNISMDKQEAHSYTFSKKWKPATETSMTLTSGAGALVSNPSDLNKFLDCLFKGGLVQDESLEMMSTLKDGFGLGMFQVPFYEKKAYGHTGGIDGFQANAFYFPEEDVAISYTSNAVVMAVNSIMIGALSIYFDKDYTFPVFKPGIDLEAKDLEPFQGIYSSADFPLKITVTMKGDQLFCQATGQSQIPLKAIEPRIFTFDQAMLEIEFLPEDSKLILKQGGGEFELAKE